MSSKIPIVLFVTFNLGILIAVLGEVFFDYLGAALMFFSVWHLLKPLVRKTKAD